MLDARTIRRRTVDRRGPLKIKVPIFDAQEDIGYWPFIGDVVQPEPCKPAVIPGLATKIHVGQRPKKWKAAGRPARKHELSTNRAAVATINVRAGIATGAENHQTIPRVTNPHSGRRQIGN